MQDFYHQPEESSEFDPEFSEARTFTPRGV